MVDTAGGAVAGDAGVSGGVTDKISTGDFLVVEEELFASFLAALIGASSIALKRFTFDISDWHDKKAANARIRKAGTNSQGILARAKSE